MKILAKCCECGSEVDLDYAGGGDDFTEAWKRLMVNAAMCAPCEVLHETQMKIHEEQRLRELEEQRAKRFEQEFAGSVGRKYRGCTLGTFRAATQSQATAHKASAEFCRDPQGFLYLHGKPGVGKTHLAAAIYREHVIRGAMFWAVPELLLHLRSQMGGDVSEEQAIDPLIKAPLLVLDDMGAEKITDWVRQAFYVVISRRERDELPTVITSNLSLGEIESRVGDERITSRIAGAARIIRVEGVDARIEGRASRR